MTVILVNKAMIGGIKMENVLAMIQQASHEDLERIMTAVECRYAAAFPDWEVIYMAIHREPDARRADILEMLAFLQKELDRCL